MPVSDFLPRTGQQRAPKQLPPVSAFAGDDGRAPAGLTAALATEPDVRLEAVVAALATSRVLVPVVAHEETEKDADLRERFTGRRERTDAAQTPAAPAPEAEDCHGEREASASLVTVQTPDGRAALPVFSSVAALAAWRSDARPVPHQAVRTAMAAVDEAGGVMVLDPASPHSLLIPRPAVWALAREERWVPALRDAAVLTEVTTVVAAVDGVERVQAVAGERAEVKIELAVRAGLTRAQVEQVAQEVATALSLSAVVAERVDSLELALTTA